MARYTGPDCRLCRREKTKLFLKGSKCESPKCPVEKRPYPPGEHGRGRVKESEYLLQLLETRLDNVVYRGGLARSRDQARQLVRHSHVTVNGRKVNIPSYQVKPGDVVQVKERMRQNLNVHESIQLQTGRPQPGWLELNAGEARLTVTSIPTRDQVEVPIQEQLIVELYSK